jgi:hypothetical protein
MKTNSRLSAWLHSKMKDYQEGVKIFSEISNDKESIRFFQQGKPGKIHRSILERKLTNYARIHHVVPAPLPEKKPVEEKIHTQKHSKRMDEFSPDVLMQIETEKNVIQRPMVDKNPVVRYEELPERLQVLYDENGKMYSEMKAFHAEIKQLKENESAKERREELAQEIVRREKSIRENWDVIDAWWAKNQEADPLKQAAEEALSKDRRIKADLAYIRRFLGKAKSKEEVELRMKELDKWNVDYGNLTKNWDSTWK